MEETETKERTSSGTSQNGGVAMATETAQETLLGKLDLAVKMRRGLLTMIGLMILTAIVFWVAVSFTGTIPFLTVLALAKTLLIVQYFMHMKQLWHAEE